MIPFISNLFNFPVTRKEVLERAKKFKDECICYSIRYALVKYNITHGFQGYQLTRYFPKFTRRNALKFGADRIRDFWWEPDDWDNGRMDFLDWLIDQYKDDKTDLRKL